MAQELWEVKELLLKDLHKDWRLMWEVQANWLETMEKEIKMLR